MTLYQVSAETVNKLEAVAKALGVKYHDEAIEVLIAAAYRVTVSQTEEGEAIRANQGFVKGRLLALMPYVDAK